MSFGMIGGEILMIALISGIPLIPTNSVISRFPMISIIPVISTMSVFSNDSTAANESSDYGGHSNSDGTCF